MWVGGRFATLLDYNQGLLMRRGQAKPLFEWHMCGRIHTVSFLSYSGILCIGRFWHFLFVLLAFGPIIGLEKVLHDVTSNILKVRSPSNDASEGAKGEELGF